MISQDPINEYRELSDAQEKVLAILPIPSALLSIIGSAITIRMAFQSKRSKPWTPYHGFVTAMGICNIIWSITLVIGSFLYPRSTSNKVWAFGSDASCNAVGFFNQFSHSTILYGAALSFYFLLSVRFGYTDEWIAFRFETPLHVLCLGYPLVTAFAGLFLDSYGERQVRRRLKESFYDPDAMISIIKLLQTSIGCWIQTCEFDAEGNVEDCSNTAVDAFFGRLPTIFVVGCLIINNLILLAHMGKIVKQRKSIEKDRNQRRPLDDLDDTVLETNKGREAARYETMRRRLRMMRSQTFLFVGGYVLCNFVTFGLRNGIADPFEFNYHSTSYVEEMEIPYKYYPLLVMQAILYPLQGVFHFVVIVQPRYSTIRSSFPEKSRFWAIWRSIAESEKTMTRSTSSVLNEKSTRVSASVAAFGAVLPVTAPHSEESNEGFETGSNIGDREGEGEDARSKKYTHCSATVLLMNGSIQKSHPVTGLTGASNSTGS